MKKNEELRAFGNYIMTQVDAARSEWANMSSAKKMAYASADDDPEPPARRAKRPMTAYMLYSAKIRKLDPKPSHLDKLKPSEVMAEIGKMWNELPPEQKDEFQRMAEAEKLRVATDEASELQRTDTGVDAP